MRQTSSTNAQSGPSLSRQKHHTTADGWWQAVVLCERSASDVDAKADALLMNELSASISADQRARCQFLFYGALRYRVLFDSVIDPMVPRGIRPRMRTLLHVAMAEFYLSQGRQREVVWAKVVDYTVNQAKKRLSLGEARLANALLRKIPAALELAEKEAPLHVRYSHPEWLVQRWLEQFGAEKTEALLAHNQKIPKIYFRWFSKQEPEFAASASHFDLRAGEEQEPQPTFYQLEDSAGWGALEAALKKGEAYVQDPATWWAPALLDVQQGESVLDLCAAPGGKSVQLLRALGKDEKGLLVALDCPGARINQLDENLRHHNDGKGPEVHLVTLDLREASTDDLGLFDAVLLDAPCSNTGVIRRRPDVKWRLLKTDIATQAKMQLTLLEKAAEFVAPGGRLVYSTCSLEQEENRGVIDAFLQKHPDWELTEAVTVFPPDYDHDGAGAFRLERK